MYSLSVLQLPKFPPFKLCNSEIQQWSWWVFRGKFPFSFEKLGTSPLNLYHNVLNQANILITKLNSFKMCWKFNSPHQRYYHITIRFCSAQMPYVIVTVMLFLSSVAIHAYIILFSSFLARYTPHILLGTSWSSLSALIWLPYARINSWIMTYQASKQKCLTSFNFYYVIKYV